MDLYYRLFPLYDTLLLTSVVLLGLGMLGKTGRPRLAAAGDVLFGVFWLTQVPYYYADHSYDAAIFGVLVFLFFCILGFRQWNGDTRQRELRFPAVAALAGSVLYFPFAKVPLLSLLIIYFVTYQSVWVANLFGVDLEVGPTNMAGNGLYYMSNYLPGEEIHVVVYHNGEPSGLALIVACTGLQVMVLFACILLASWASMKKRMLFLAISVVSLHVLNVFRNVAIFYLVVVRGVSFEVAHGYMGITLSLVAIGALAFAAFLWLPKLHEEILDTLAFPFKTMRGR